MLFDSTIIQADITAAVRALKAVRNNPKALDQLVDAIRPRRVAHVAEEALRAGTTSPLHQHTGLDTALISVAVTRLNSCHLRKPSSAGTRLRTRDGS